MMSDWLKGQNNNQIQVGVVTKSNVTKQIGPMRPGQTPTSFKISKSE